MKLKQLPKDELVYGHLACAGCGGMLAARMALKVLGRETVFVLPACCNMAVTCFYPQVPFEIPYLVSSFPGTASMVSGVVAGLKRQGREDINVVGLAGDGGTLDIGLQALSGAVERRENFLYICYDNEAYMNTGIQRSSATPYGAKTTTTPEKMFENLHKKDLLRIMAAHDIPFAATASVGHPLDYLKKVEKAAGIKGPKVLHVLAPCPTGWGIKSEDTVKYAKLAVQTGAWVLAEYSGGEIVSKKPGGKKPVQEYLKGQGRFKHLSSEDVRVIQERIDSNLEQNYSNRG